jgi:uncharacterized protein
MSKALLIFLGSLFLVIGIVGIVVPGLPTTPFLLLSAALYLRSSKRLHGWLVNHRIFGKFVRNFQEGKTWTRASKIISILIMWGMISLSVFIFLDVLLWKVVVLGAGATGTFFMVRIKSEKNDQN